MDHSFSPHPSAFKPQFSTHYNNSPSYTASMNKLPNSKLSPASTYHSHNSHNNGLTRIKSSDTLYHITEQQSKVQSNTQVSMQQSCFKAFAAKNKYRNQGLKNNNEDNNPNGGSRLQEQYGKVKNYLIKTQQENNQLKGQVCSLKQINKDLQYSLARMQKTAHFPTSPCEYNQLIEFEEIVQKSKCGNGKQIKNRHNMYCSGDNQSVWETFKNQQSLHKYNANLKSQSSIPDINHFPQSHKKINYNEGESKKSIDMSDDDISYLLKRAHQEIQTRDRKIQQLQKTLASLKHKNQESSQFHSSSNQDYQSLKKLCQESIGQSSILSKKVQFLQNQVQILKQKLKSLLEYSQKEYERLSRKQLNLEIEKQQINNLLKQKYESLSHNRFIEIESPNIKANSKIMTKEYQIIEATPRFRASQNQAQYRMEFERKKRGFVQWNS